MTADKLNFKYPGPAAGLAAVCIFLSAVFPLYSDENAAGRAGTASTGPDEPSETEIILPEMYLEIEDLTIEEIDAVIPDNDEVLLSSIELPLPEPDRIEIPAEVFAVSGPAVPSSAFSAGDQPQSSFYSEATIGVGTSANIIGDINLYHIGEQPDFRLKYFHDGYDGIFGKEAGEGFSGREDLLEAEVNYSDEKSSADLILSYNELESGLQGQTGYYTMTRRIPELEAEAEWRPAGNFVLGGAVDASAAGIQLNAGSPSLSYSMFAAEPELSAFFEGKNLNAGARLNYAIRGETGSAGFTQDLGGELFLNYEPAEIFRMSLEAGLLWDNLQRLYYPFEAAFSGAAAAFDYSIAGGYRAFYAGRTSLWDISPAAAGPESEASLGSVPMTRGWFGEAGLRWSLSDSLAVRASGEFTSYENALMPAASSLSGFYTVTGVDSICFDAAAGMFWRLSDGFNLSLGWSGQLLEQMDWYRPRHLFDAAVELTSQDRNMGLVADLEMNVYDPVQTWYTNDWLPNVGLEWYLRLSEGLVISVTGEDIGSMLLEDGRTGWGEYLDKGAGVQAKIKISL